MAGSGRLSVDRLPERIDGHWYIDGKYGHGADQRICADLNDGTCMGIPSDDGYCDDDEMSAVRSRFPCLVCGAAPVVITMDIQLCSIHARQWAESQLSFGVWMAMDGRKGV